MKIETPSGRTIETQMKKLRCYVEKNVPLQCVAYQREGHSQADAEALAMEWGNGVVRGCLKNLSVEVFLSS